MVDCSCEVETVKPRWSIEAVKASINVSLCNDSYKSCTLLLYAKKRKLFTRNIYIFTKKHFLRSPNSSAKNWFATVQTDLKCPQVFSYAPGCNFARMTSKNI